MYTAVAVVAVIPIAASFLYSPGPPAYTLTAKALTIHDRFYPATVNASDVDIDRMRIVDIKTSQDWRPTLRTNGFAVPHYRSGWFRVASGQTVRMYRADATLLVLLPPKRGGTGVLLEVNEPERFLATVRREWASRS